MVFLLCWIFGFILTVAWDDEPYLKRVGLLVFVACAWPVLLLILLAHNAPD